MEQKDWPLLPEAIRIVVAADRASTSYLQRKLAIGYNQAARLIEEMEARGVVSNPCQFGKRDVLWCAKDIPAPEPQDEEPTIRIRTADGTDTGDVPMSHVGAALDELKAADRKRRKATPMKNTPEDKKVEDRAYGVAAGELRQFIEQAEQMAAEKRDAAEREKEIFAEAKARGYDSKAMKKIIALRKRDKDDVAEEEAILDMYKAALGMA